MSDRPLRVAVVGSGPAGSTPRGAAASDEPSVEVDLIDRLPTPWGLVRLGVAPDHPNIKAVSRAFEKIALQPGFRFLGNVEVGRDVTHEELDEAYDAVVYAIGAQTDRRLGIPGEDLPGSWPATAFVAWYNGHPDFQELEFDLSRERAVVIGNGNVALDVARMLALTPEELAPTDTTDAAIDAIDGAAVNEILVLGRRGPVQAAFTTVELRRARRSRRRRHRRRSGRPRARRGERGVSSRRRHDREAKHRAPARVRGARARGQAARIRLRFLMSPAAILGDERVEAIELVRNELVRRAAAAASRPTSARRSRAGSSFAASATAGPARRAFRSTSAPARSPTTAGACSRTARPPGRLLRRLDQAGADRRDRNEQEGRDGDRGLLLEDARAGRLPSAAARRAGDRPLLAERGIDVVTQPGWEAIDAAERGAASPQGRPRVKLSEWEALLAAAPGPTPRWPIRPRR